MEKSSEDFCPGGTNVLSFNNGNGLHFFNHSSPKMGSVRVEIYDLRGRQVAFADLGVLPAGEHLFPWSARDPRGSELPAGVYFARVRAGSALASDRMMLLR
jgi:flagellar hook assembly protein FlgD